METSYDKAIRMKYKIAKSKDKCLSIKRATTLNLNPTKLVELYPRTFKIENNQVKFNIQVVNDERLNEPINFN